VGWFVRGYIEGKRVASISVELPAAAVSADKAAEKIDKIAKEISEARETRQEVIDNAKKNAVGAVTDLDVDAIAELWNARLGEYRMGATGQRPE